MMYAKVFLVGGLICAAGQLLLLYTNLTSARILVAFVTAGVVLTALGLYEPLVEWAGAGATVPLALATAWPPARARRWRRAACSARSPGA